MKLTKWLSLLLVCVFILTPVLCSCGNGDDGLDDGGDRGADGSWDNVNFEGATVTVCVSANQDHEVTFPAADIYTKGPDTTTTDEVQKKVLARNTRVADTLNLDVQYRTTNLKYNLVLDDIAKLVQGAAEDAPDIYNNDMLGLTSAMVAGYLWNLTDPGTDVNGKAVKSYFDFTAEGWNYAFMKGCTLDQNKLYILAGDYFLDMIRMAWVLYVNADIFNENAAALDYDDVDHFYSYVEEGIWDYEMLRRICKKIWKDDGGERGLTEKDDSRLGLAINHVSTWIFSSSTGITTYYQDENGVPRALEDINEFNIMANALRTIYCYEGTGEGIYWEGEVLSSTKYFMQGNVLFAQSVLGELESPDMRNLSFQKGLVPIPKYDEQRQAEYHTMVHDQTELGAILNNAKSFGRASALMQMLNEESTDVVHEYYEKGLKFKYSEDKGIRSMIDLVYNTIDTPFGMQIGAKGSSVSADLKGMIEAIKDNTVASTFGSEKESYQKRLASALENFAKLE